VINQSPLLLKFHKRWDIAKDTVVWLNLSSGIYHFRGQRWYANTNNGAFVCEQEADMAGDRATLNGQ